jgi:hypothetical protein
MAVYQSDGSTYDANWTGIIDIEDQCVFLTDRLGTNRTLVAWPNRYVRWNPVAETIFILKPGSSTELTDGMQVEVGGGGMDLERIEQAFGWVAPPNLECVTEGTWLAGGDVDTASFGPLAVRVPAGVFYDGVGMGTLVITDNCAFLDEDRGGRQLIVWPESPDTWRWDPATSEIVSLGVGPDIRTRRFASGDSVRLGGATVDSQTQAQMLEDTVWVDPPEDDCMTTTVFFSNGEISEG